MLVYNQVLLITDHALSMHFQGLSRAYKLGPLIGPPNPPLAHCVKLIVAALGFEPTIPTHHKSHYATEATMKTLNIST